MAYKMYVQALNVQLFSSKQSLTDDGENKNVSLSLRQKIRLFGRHCNIYSNIYKG